MKVIIKENFKEDYTTRPAGERLRDIILENEELIEIDFSEVKVASASFFDEAFAKLISEYNWKKIDFDTRVKFLNLYKHDLSLLNQVCQTRGANFEF